MKVKFYTNPYKIRTLNSEKGFKKGDQGAHRLPYFDPERTITRHRIVKKNWRGGQRNMGIL